MYFDRIIRSHSVQQHISTIKTAVPPMRKKRELITTDKTLKPKTDEIPETLDNKASLKHKKVKRIKSLKQRKELG